MNNPATASLRVLDGPDSGFVVPLQEGNPLRVGSSMSGDVVVAGLAQVHAEFLWQKGTLSLVATGPVTVNGASLRKAELGDGDEVWLAGQMMFGVSLPEGGTAVPPPIPVAAAEPGWEIDSNPFQAPGGPVVPSADPPDGLDFAPSLISFSTAEAPAAPPTAPPTVAPPPAAAPAAPPLVSFATPTPASAPPPVAPIVRQAPAGAAARPASRAVPPPAPRRPAARPAPGLARPGTGTRVLWTVAAGAGAAVLLGGAGYAYWMTRPPQIASLQPVSGFAGDEVVIEGEHLTSDATKVRFGTALAQVVVAERQRLRVKVPAVPVKARTRLEVTVETPRGQASTAFELRARPRWDSLAPQVALPGESITLLGAGLDAGPLQVSVAGQAAPVQESGAERVVVRLPELQGEMSTRDPVSVVLRVDGQEVQRREIRLGRLPYVTEVTPRKVVPGEEITVRGFGFDSAPGVLQAFIAGQPSLVLAATESSLTICVPTFTRSVPEASVEVVAGAARSLGGPGVQVERMTSGSYMLRFLPAVVPDRPELADVASEFAPVLRLASPANAPDVRRRARLLATALNQMVAAAVTGHPVALEVRDVGDGIWLAQVGGLALTRVDPQDAEAYAPGLSPRALAEHWAALLEDHLVLFVRHDRPTRMTTRSPLGRAMTELQVALLRTRGAEVPPDAPERVSAALAARLGRMALEVPRSGAAPVSASAFEGEWQGQLSGAAFGAPQGLTLTLRPAGTGLSGVLRMESGAGGLEQPAVGLLVQGERLSFRVALRGGQRQFVATRIGSTLSGTVRSPDGARDEGQFELKLQIR